MKSDSRQDRPFTNAELSFEVASALGALQLVKHWPTERNRSEEKSNETTLSFDKREQESESGASMTTASH